MTIWSGLDQLEARRLAFREWWNQTRRLNRLPEDAARDAFCAGWTKRGEWRGEERKESK